MLTIGKIAAQAALTTNALRFYEREGLIRPAAKSPSGYRLYGDDTLERVRFIKHAQHCGFTIGEIVELFSLREQKLACCGDVRRLALEKKLQLEARIRTMKAMSKALDTLIAGCPDEDRPVDECAILGAMARSLKKATT